MQLPMNVGKIYKSSVILTKKSIVIYYNHKHLFNARHLLKSSESKRLEITKPCPVQSTGKSNYFNISIHVPCIFYYFVK